MKLLIWVVALAFLASLTGCETTPTHTKTTQPSKARVTFYNPFERDRVCVRKGKHRRWRWITWGRRTSSGVRAISGVTCAAPPWIPFGTRVRFPQLRNVIGTGEFVVQDRGAGHRLLRTREWFDVFVDNRRVMRRLQYGLPEFLDYEIIPPIRF